MSPTPERAKNTPCVPPMTGNRCGECGDPGTSPHGDVTATAGRSDTPSIGLECRGSARSTTTAGHLARALLRRLRRASTDGLQPLDHVVHSGPAPLGGVQCRCRFPHRLGFRRPQLRGQSADTRPRRHRHHAASTPTGGRVQGNIGRRLRGLTPHSAVSPSGRHLNLSAYRRPSGRRSRRGRHRRGRRH